MADLRPTKARMVLLKQIDDGQVENDPTGVTVVDPLGRVVTGRVRELEAAGWVAMRTPFNEWALTAVGKQILAEHGTMDRYTGRNNPGLAAILATGVTYRQLENWVTLGHLRPDVTPVKGGSRDTWSWPPAEQQVAIAMGRLAAAGLRPAAAEKVARAPLAMPVVLGPQIVISLFPLRPPTAQAVKAS